MGGDLGQEGQHTVTLFDRATRGRLEEALQRSLQLAHSLFPASTSSHQCLMIIITL